MIIDCGSCTVRGDACTDCVVTFLTIPVRDEPAGRAPRTRFAPAADGTAPRTAAHPGAARRVAAPGGTGTGHPGTGGPGRPAVDLDDAERQAIAVLAEGGLVPPLRMVRAV